MYRVRGILFADYVRMIRSRRDIEWNRHLPPEDIALVTQRVKPTEWYPMAAFERMGNAILAEVAKLDLDMVRAFGKFSVMPLRESEPNLVCEGDPIETLMRFRERGLTAVSRGIAAHSIAEMPLVTELERAKSELGEDDLAGLDALTATISPAFDALEARVLAEATGQAAAGVEPEKTAAP